MSKKTFSLDETTPMLKRFRGLLNRLAYYNFDSAKSLTENATAVCQKIRELSGEEDTGANRLRRRIYIRAINKVLNPLPDAYMELWKDSEPIKPDVGEPSEDGWKDISGVPGYQVHPDGHIRAASGKIIHRSEAQNGYIYHTLNGRSYLAHRLIAEAFVPNPNGHTEIDHLNQNPIDNRASNLRWASRQEQLRNRAPYGRSGTKCIIKSGKQYYVTIVRNSKIAFQGHFKTLEEAVAARDAATAELDGQMT